MKCRNCGEEVEDGLDTCPYCHKKMPQGGSGRKSGKGGLIAIIAAMVFVFLVIILAVLDKGSSPADASAAQSSTVYESTENNAAAASQPDSNADTAAEDTSDTVKTDPEAAAQMPDGEEKLTELTGPEAEKTAGSTTENAEDSVQEASLSDVPQEYRDALHRAELYSEYMKFSEESIRHQLTAEYGENFSEEAADYALKHLDVDYYENAYFKAQAYAEATEMNYEDIYNALITEEQFTTREAQYAVKKMYNEAAASASNSAPKK